MPKRPVKSGKPVALGCHIFAGGFTVGVLSAGFNVTAHLEGEAGYGSSSFSANYPHIPVYKGGWDSAALDGVDFIYGNPPCAAWSGNNSASHKADSWEKDPRVNCTREHFGLLERGRPKVWAWESVCAAPEKGKKLVDELTKRAVGLGYSVTQVFHEAAYLGVAQTRKRWFLVAHNIAIPWEEPAWDGVLKVKDALKGVCPIGPPAYDSRGNERVFKPVLKDLQQGERLRRFWERTNPEKGRTTKENGHVKGRPGFGHVRLKADSVATATVGYSMVHPTQHRFLSVNEVAVLAGFPNGYKFMGGELGAQQLDLIARGVCPPVGAWLARSVMAGIKADSKLRKPRVTILDFRNRGIDPVDTTAQFV